MCQKGILHTNKGHPVAESKHVVHKKLGMNAAIVIRVASRYQGRLRHLEDNKRWNSGRLALAKSMVRRFNSDRS